MDFDREMNLENAGIDAFNTESVGSCIVREESQNTELSPLSGENPKQTNHRVTLRYCTVQYPGVAESFNCRIIGNRTDIHPGDFVEVSGARGSQIRIAKVLDVQEYSYDRYPSDSYKMPCVHHKIPEASRERCLKLWNTLEEDMQVPAKRKALLPNLPKCIPIPVPEGKKQEGEKTYRLCAVKFRREYDLSKIEEIPEAGTEKNNLEKKRKNTLPPGKRALRATILLILISWLILLLAAVIKNDYKKYHPPENSVQEVIDSPENAEKHTPRPTAKPTTRPTSVPRKTPRPTQRPSLSSKESDPYDAKSYAHPDDFYYEYIDDFLDYEDAEDYWEKYN